MLLPLPAAVYHYHTVVLPMPCVQTHLLVGSWCSVIMGGRLFVLSLVVHENSEQITVEEYSHIHFVYEFCHGAARAVVKEYRYWFPTCWHLS
jgi:hypothetical protein